MKLHFEKTDVSWTLLLTRKPKTKENLIGKLLFRTKLVVPEQNNIFVGSEPQTDHYIGYGCEGVQISEVRVICFRFQLLFAYKMME